MQFSYSAVWDDTVRMVRANASLLLAVAGAFLFLPAVIVGFVAPQPTEAATLEIFLAYVAAHWPLLLAVNFIGVTGNLALLILVLDQGRPTVGRAIGAAAMLLPFYFVASLLSGFIIGIGIVLLILPGLYLIGRLAVLGAVMVAEGRRGPIDAIRSTFAVTKGRGWAIIGLVMLVVLAFYIVNFAFTAVFGSLFLLLDHARGGPGIGALLKLIMEGALGAIFSTTLIVLIASIYRRLTSGT